MMRLSWAILRPSLLCKFSYSLITGFILDVPGDLGRNLWCLSAQRLVGPEFIVVEHIFENFIGELSGAVEGGALDDIVIDGAPEAFDLAVGLRPVRPGVA